MELRQRLQRGWILIVLGALAGLALGLVIPLSDTVVRSSPAEPSPVDRPFHEAIHTLYVDENRLPNESQVLVTPLGQAARIATSGSVPRFVAAEVGLDFETVTERIATYEDTDARTLDIVAVGTTSEEARQLADGFAAVLIDFYVTEANELFEAERAKQQSVIADSEAAIEQLLADRDVARVVLDTRRLADIEDQLVAQAEILSVGETALAELESSGAAAVALRSVDASESRSITKGRYESQIALAVAGANALDQPYVAEVDAVADPVVAHVTPEERGPALRIALAAAGGLVGAAFAALSIVLFALRRPAIRGIRDIDAHVPLPVLAVIPKLSDDESSVERPVALNAPRSPVAEAHRELLETLEQAESKRLDALKSEAGDMFETELQRAAVVLVTSPGEDEGKTTTVANLATVLAETGLEVLAINADDVRPALHRHLGVKLRSGVSATNVEGVALVSQPVHPGLEPEETSTAITDLIARSRDIVDVIVVDGGALLDSRSLPTMLDAVDHVLLTARVGATKRADLNAAAKLLARQSAPAVGVVLIGARGNDASVEDAFSERLATDAFFAVTPEPEPVAAPRSMFDAAQTFDADPFDAADGPADIEDAPVHASVPLVPPPLPGDGLPVWQGPTSAQPVDHPLAVSSSVVGEPVAPMPTPADEPSLDRSPPNFDTSDAPAAESLFDAPATAGDLFAPAPTSATSPQPAPVPEPFPAPADLFDAAPAEDFNPFAGASAADSFLPEPPDVADPFVPASPATPDAFVDPQ